MFGGPEGTTSREGRRVNLRRRQAVPSAPVTENNSAIWGLTRSVHILRHYGAPIDGGHFQGRRRCHRRGRVLSPVTGLSLRRRPRPRRLLPTQRLLMLLLLQGLRDGLHHLQLLWIGQVTGGGGVV